MLADVLERFRKITFLGRLMRKEIVIILLYWEKLPILPQPQILWLYFDISLLIEAY